MSAGSWRMYGAEISEGVAEDGDGNPCSGWIQVVCGDCRAPEQATVSIPPLDGSGGPDWVLPLVATWDHEPTEEEIQSAKPEDYQHD